jgi:hypothetical protein
MTTARFRGFAAALLLASLLAGAAIALGGASLIERVAAALLTASVWFVGVGVVTGRHPLRFPWIVLLAAAVLGLFAFRLPDSSPWSPRSLHVAAVLSYGAVAVASMLAPLRFVGEGKALLLTFSTAVALLSAEMLIRPPKPVQMTEWDVKLIEDPHVEVRYAPNSTARMFYPDNPRGYFLQGDPRQNSWSLTTFAGSAARLEHLSSPAGAVRVTIPKLVGTDVFNVKLRHAPFRITKGTRYVLRFRARAEAPRPMYCAVCNNHDPWELLGVYGKVDLQQEWKDFECAFEATGTDSNAQAFFDLGTSDAAVELSDVVLHNESTGQDEPPVLPPARFFVDYRFNSLGFRGPDPIVPRPPGTYRILALGDSYANGVGVHEQDTFEVKLQDSLNRAEAGRGGAITYEVINGGVSGYATRQALRSYELFSSTYEPQVVLLVMVFNDDMSFQEEVRRGLFATSANPGGLTNLRNRIQPPVRQYDYSDSILALKELNEATRQRGAKLAVVIFTNVRGFDPWDKLAKAVDDGLKGTGVPILNLQDALLSGDRDGRELHVHAIDGHPNEIAHGIAAVEIERFLRAEGLLARDE